MLVRQGVALGVGALVLILVVLGIKGCVDSQRTNSLKDYNRNVAAVVTDSDQNVGKPFFKDLEQGPTQGNSLQVAVNQLRLAAEQDARRAQAFDVPGAMTGPQRNLLLLLNLRAGALQRVADEIPSALGRGETSRSAINRIAGEMQAILAADVIYSQRVAPLIKEGLDSNGVHGQEIATSKWLTDFSWLAPARVATALGGTSAGGGGGGGGAGTACPAGSLCGHSLDAVSVGTTTLPPGGGPVRIVVTPGLAFSVKFSNGGTVDESNVRVRIEIKAPGTKTVTTTHTVSTSKAGTTTTVQIPVPASPPIGTPATVTTTVSPVPGESNTSNNTQSTTVIFSRG